MMKIIRGVPLGILTVVDGLSLILTLGFYCTRLGMWYIFWFDINYLKRKIKNEC